MAGLTAAQSPKIGLEIVHAIPGRVRLKVKRGTPYKVVEKIVAYLQEQSGIVEVKFNQQTNSLTIAFNESECSKQQIFKLLQGYGVEWQKEISTHPMPILQTPVESFVPLMVGMLITQRLGIQGLPALPVYMIAATTTRQVLEQLPLELSLFSGISENVNSETTPVQSSEKIAYRLVQAIPGRVRIYIPRIASDPAYTRRLKQLVESTEAVTGVRVNTAAASLIVNYKINAVSEADFCERLLTIIQQAGTPMPKQLSKITPETIVKNGKPQPQIVGESLTREPNLPNLEIAPAETAIKNGCSFHMETPAITKIESQNQSQNQKTTTSEKTSFWANYKPPALSIFLKFMANLY